MLRAVSSALGLWMHHPDKGLFVDDAPADAALTDRQVRILRLVAAGRSNAAIAAYLGYSPSTVKQELQRVRVLLETVDRDASARRARELGLLPEIS